METVKKKSYCKSVLSGKTGLLEDWLIGRLVDWLPLEASTSFHSHLVDPGELWESGAAEGSK